MPAGHEGSCWSEQGGGKELFELHSSSATVVDDVVLRAEFAGCAPQAAAGCVLRLWIPSLVVNGQWTPLTEAGEPDGGPGECTYDHTGGADFSAISADRIRPAGEVAPSYASALTRPEEWLVFSARGEPAPDGSNNASIAGLICTDGTGEYYPDLDGACASTGLSSWQLSGAQFSNGLIIATGYRDTTMDAAVSGKKNSEIWLFDPLRQQMVRQLLTRDTHDDRELSVDAVLPGDERLVVGVSELPMGRQLLTMDLDGGNQAEITQPGQGHHYGTHLSSRPAPGGCWRLSCHVTGGVSAAVRAKSAHLDANPFRIGFYSINAFELSDAAAGSVSSRTLVHGQEGHLLFDPTWSPDSRSLVYLDCHPAEDPSHTRADIVVATLSDDGSWSEPRWLTTDQRHWFGTSFGPADARGGGSNTSSWSPDGAYVTYTRLTPGAHPDAYYDASRPNHEENVFAPELARGGTQICLIDVKSGDVHELTEAVEGRWDFRPTFAQFSPSASCIIFTRVPTVGACSELWAMEVDGSNERLLTTGPLNGKGVDHPRWLPHGMGLGENGTDGPIRGAMAERTRL
eukprot:COSAG02_NODE_241_length_27638_cov_13.101020_12_plen_571_part_00